MVEVEIENGRSRGRVVEVKVRATKVRVEL